MKPILSTIKPVKMWFNTTTFITTIEYSIMIGKHEETKYYSFKGKFVKKHTIYEVTEFLREQLRHKNLL